MQEFSRAKHWFVTAAKLCRGAGDCFFESIYENKTGMITSKAIVIWRKDKYCHSWF